MSLRKATPGEGGASVRVHFRYVSVGYGKSWAAHVAGEPYWLMAHTSERSKPCLDWITHGRLPCPLCSRPTPPVEMAYMPLYRSSDGCPVMVVIYADQRDHADKLALHERVMVGREGEKGDAVYIRRAFEQSPKYQSTLACRMFPADLTDTLLVMWKIPELVEWYKAQPKGSDNAVSLPDGVAVTDQGKPVSPMNQAAAKRNGFKTVKADTLNASYDKVKAELLAKAAKLPPGTNGNGKHGHE